MGGHKFGHSQLTLTEIELRALNHALLSEHDAFDDRPDLVSALARVKTKVAEARRKFDDVAGQRPSR